jgi:opacity protein-like surface antigen
MDGRMRRRWRVLGLALLAWLASAPAALAQGIDYARPGPYVAVDFALGDEDFKQSLESRSFFQDTYELDPQQIGPADPHDDIVLVSCCSFSTNMVVGVNGRVGYRLHPRLALETEVNWMSPWNVKSEADFVSNFTTPVPFTGNLRVEPIVLTANAKLYLLTGRFQPFLSVGSGAYFLDMEDKGLGARNLTIPQSTPGQPASDPNFRRDLPCASSTNPIDNSGLDSNGRFRMCANTPPQDVEQWSFAMRFRGGFEYYATENVAIHSGITYVLPTGGTVKDFDYLTYDVFGILYRF